MKVKMKVKSLKKRAEKKNNRSTTKYNKKRQPVAAFSYCRISNALRMVLSYS